MTEVLDLTYADLKTMDPDYLLLPVEVAGIFRVDPKTVTRWAAAGRIEAIRTQGGHRRFRVAVVKAKIEENMEMTQNPWSE